jgi:hypothetical protein
MAPLAVASCSDTILPSSIIILSARSLSGSTQPLRTNASPLPQCGVIAEIRKERSLSRWVGGRLLADERSEFGEGSGTVMDVGCFFVLLCLCAICVLVCLCAICMLVCLCAICVLVCCLCCLCACVLVCLCACVCLYVCVRACGWEEGKG